MQECEAGNIETKAARPSVALILLLCIAICCAYANVSFDFFVGDDFVHLAWLRQAMQNPELIWRNFHTSWLEIPTTKFYRPLISVFMVADYALWHVNGLGFHITNILLLLISTTCLCFIAHKLFYQGLKTGGWTSVVAASIFGLYPLHPEAVSWITGRVDDVVTTFYLLGLCMYIYVRQPVIRIVSTGVFTILALLSKEMAITIPALLSVYSFLYEPPNEDSGWFRRIKLSFVNTFPYWAILIAYFIVRRIALGTFVGGYDDSSPLIGNIPVVLAGWLRGLHMLMVPINQKIVGPHNVLTVSWYLCFIASVLLAGARVLKHTELRRQALFLFFWLALSLMPVYKIFAIGKDLQGSRLAFLASAPLALLLALGLAVPFKRVSLRITSHVVAALFPFLCLTLLFINNSSWQNAGQQANSIRRALNQFYRRTPGDPQVMIIGLPDHYKGAFVARNSLDGMTKYPQLCRDIQNCIAVNSFDSVLPFGYLKDSLLSNWNKVTILRWDIATESLIRIPPPASQRSDIEHLHYALKIEPDEADAQSASSRDQGNTAGLQPHSQREPFPLSVTASKRKRPEVLLSTQIPCYSTDFLFLDATISGTNDESGTDLLYANTMNPCINYEKRIHGVTYGAGNRLLCFSIRSLPEWALGGTCNKLQFRFPTGSTVVIHDLFAMPASHLMPMVQFANSGFLGSKGFLHLTPENSPQALSVDSTNVTGSTGCTLEVTKANSFFATQNSVEPCSSCLKELHLPKCTGQIEISRTLFPAPGLYELRTWAVDGSGRRLGVAGDHIVVAVDR